MSQVTIEELIEHSVEVGGLTNLTYTNATVMCNDQQVNLAGGIPRQCFLLAAPGEYDSSGTFIPNMNEVILLKTRGVTDLNIAKELKHARLREELILDRPEQIDAHTRSSLSIVGYDCRVVGAFYRNSDSDEILFGADLDRVLAHGSYQVLKPQGKALSVIASYKKPQFNYDGSRKEIRDHLDVGVVRYSETQRNPDAAAKVVLDPEDFVGNKTAVFGTTRSGKALSEHTRIPVPVSEKFPNGWALNKELEVGDMVYGGDGQVVPILSLTDWIESDLYTVRFSDGQEVVTSGNHLWRVTENKDNHLGSVELNRNSRNGHDQVMNRVRDSLRVGEYASLNVLASMSGTTSESLADLAQASGVETHLTHQVWVDEGESRRQVKVYPARELLEFALTKTDGYGSNLNETEKVVSTEEMLAQGVKKEDGQGSKWSVKVSESIQEDSAELAIDPYAFGSWLGSLSDVEGGAAEGLDVQNKHIPVSYLRASHEQRFALLQGLMDSSGYADSGKLVFTNVTLAESVLELVRSLGIQATMSTEERSIGDKAKFRVIIFNADDEKDTTQNKLVHVESISKNGTGRVRCLTVASSDSTHLVEGFLRTHNSNSMKILIQQVFEFSKRTDQKIGQLLFDPQGEYANENVQDQGALYKMGQGKDVQIYRTRTREGTEDNQLAINFFDTNNVQLVWDLMLTEIDNSMSAGSNYISGLRSMSFEKPDKTAITDQVMYKTANVHYYRQILGLYALLHLSMFKGNIKGSVYINVGVDNVDEVLALSHNRGLSTSTNRGEVRVVTVEGAHELFNWLMLNAGDKKKEVPVDSENDDLGFDVGTVDETRSTSVLSDSWIRDFDKGTMSEFKNQFENYQKGRTGVVSAFKRLKELHSDSAREDVRNKIWDDLTKGRVVIVDLSQGSLRVATVLSELVLNHILSMASERFVSGQEPQPIQVVVEEAHNLFRREGAKGDSVDPWVRLSKEASKYKIGLLYATQEPSAVDPQILSNTANWIVAHLTSKSEIQVLGKYYTFEEWGEHLLTCESRGFVRMKMLSSPIVIPVQIHKFIPRVEY